MSSRTRGRLTIGLILGLITLPAEALLLPVARTPDAAVAAMEWAADLSLKSCSRHRSRSMRIRRCTVARSCASSIRAIAPRPGVRMLRRYLDTRTRADARSGARGAGGDGSAVRGNVHAAGRAGSRGAHHGRVRQGRRRRSGRRTARSCSSRSARRRCRGRNALPLMQRLADASAPGASSPPNCPTATATSTSTRVTSAPDPWLQCSELYSCNFDLSWPMCGPFWAWACTGWCKIIRLADA